MGARAVWFQLGVIDRAAFERTVAAGVPMVMDTCPAIEWRRRESARRAVRRARTASLRANCEAPVIRRKRRADLRVPAGPGVPDGLVVPAGELVERFSRSPGPGGQSVNTTDSRVELEYDVSGSPP